MELTTRVRILDEAVRVSLRTNALEKDTNPSVQTPASNDYIVGRLGSLGNEFTRRKTLNSISQLPEAVEYTDCIFTEGLRPPTSVQNHTKSGILGNMECPFIDIVPRSTLAQSGSTW